MLQEYNTYSFFQVKKKNKTQKEKELHQTLTKLSNVSSQTTPLDDFVSWRVKYLFLGYTCVPNNFIRP